MNSYRVLVLNSDFQPLRLIPLSTISWQEAICLVYKNSAQVVEYYDKEVRSVSSSMKIPCVIVLKKYRKLEHMPRYSKYNVKLRDDMTCQYCGKRHSHKSLTVDHVVPRAKGGKTMWENIVAACKPCNANKRDKTDIKPLKQPKVPSYYDLAKKLIHVRKDKVDQWQKYLPKLS